MARKEFKNSQFDEKNGRMRRKRVSPLTIAKLDYVDYKDTDLLNKFLSERSKIKARVAALVSAGPGGGRPAR